MNKEIKERWIDALRSGEYKQGRRCLKSGDNFCCLGVLTDLYIKETGLGKWNHYIGSSYDFFTRLDESGPSSSTLPIPVQDWASLSTNPLVNYGKFTCSIASVNDSGATFEEIAKIIEEQL